MEKEGKTNLSQLNGNIIEKYKLKNMSIPIGGQFNGNI